MTPGCINLTLKDIVKISLGAPQLNKITLTLLHSLIDLLLKKLDCENETVTIGGYEAICLQRILDKSKISPLPLNDENVEMITEKLNRLKNLEERITKVDHTLEKHLEELKNFENMENPTLNLMNWEEYKRVCEEICSVCDPDNETACKLIQNPGFLKKLTRRIATPMVERIFEFERKIEELSLEIYEFLERAEEEYKKIALIEGCMIHIEELRTRISDHEIKFIGTMEEVQDMLDAKMDKIHLPPLKQYIKTRFEEIKEYIKKLHMEQNCPRASTVIMNVKCTTCGFDRACAEEFPKPLPLMPNMPDRQFEVKKKYCACDNEWLSEKNYPKVYEHNVVFQSDKLEKKQKQTQKKPDLKSCVQTRDNLNFLVGTDGNLYRKG